ncbi:sodium channel subunit beta-3-like [Leptonychotes weddellii]|uniref:Sodium channel subunit beta-3-like n=1 Tax=Leptonychotes weddellii TaxID=9713 RepID=A0A2U3Z3S6_LEPWE|nr:sodium channel subunit beta-3-like [Leptonychotes weddellii]XP_045748696.1 sodium channel subunit beta-3 [Mirounga angustirostris]
MPAFNRLFPLASLVLIFWVSVCIPVCVEVPSETEAVQGNPMKLRCISCMKREEVEATTVVEWFYRPEGGKDFLVSTSSKLLFNWYTQYSCIRESDYLAIPSENKESSAVPVEE